jgi:cold shock CspA family protein
VTLADLKEGDKVSYDVEAAEKGPRAVNVKRA